MYSGALWHTARRLRPRGAKQRGALLRRRRSQRDQAIDRELSLPPFLRRTKVRRSAGQAARPLALVAGSVPAGPPSGKPSRGARRAPAFSSASPVLRRGATRLGSAGPRHAQQGTLGLACGARRRLTPSFSPSLPSNATTSLREVKPKRNEGLSPEAVPASLRDVKPHLLVQDAQFSVEPSSLLIISIKMVIIKIYGSSKKTYVQIKDG